MLNSTPGNPPQIPGLPANVRDFSKLPSKRRRDAICGLGTFNKPFSIKPAQESNYERQATFKPVRIIGRSQLPLVFLDLSPNKTFAPNSFFTANITILEQHAARVDATRIPVVLIARFEADKSLWVIERARERLYTLCKLVGWLKEKDVADLWDPESLTRYPVVPQIKQEEDAEDKKWWQIAVVSTRSNTEASTTFAQPVKSTMLRPKPGDTKKPSIPPHLNASYGGAGESSNDLGVPRDAPGQLSGQQICENLVQQYLDAVYMSKTSLAYFAKGPITRVRVAFTSTEEGAPPTYELVGFLRSMLLSHKSSEKKYREKLPEVIKSIPPGYLSDEEMVEKTLKPKKSKKRLKLSREGVYLQEEGIIKKWWNSERPQPETYGEESTEQRIKRRIGDLRIRETFAQLILMLEIVALESLSTYTPALETSNEQGNEPQNSKEGQPKQKKRKKKLDDIKLLIDLLLDKLCIWQSVDLDEVFSFDAKQARHGNAADETGKGGGGDKLQNFCVEVIIPFYMSRLPEQAIMINKKLGGPAHTSPPKRKAMRPPITSRKSGEPKQPEEKKARRALGRVVTDTNAQTNQRKPTPSLNRSVTDSALLNGIKRERSEVPLSAIPFKRSPSATSRQSMSQFKHMSRREVDLTTPSEAAVAKMRQKKRVEEDLKDAISALKKPNRGLAVGGYVAENERRGLGQPNSKLRKPANPVRKVQDSVQVAATPRAVRKTRDFDDRTPSHRRNPFTRAPVEDTPSSRNSYIPSSAIHPPSSLVPATVQRSQGSGALAKPSASETPSRAPMSKSLSFSGAINIESNSMNKKLPPPFKLAMSNSSGSQGNETVFKTPPRPRPKLLNDVTSNRRDSRAIFETPIKGQKPTPTKSGLVQGPTDAGTVLATPDGRAFVSMTPTNEATSKIVDSSPPQDTENRGTANEDGGQSIYDALGWNDDDDLY